MSEIQTIMTADETGERLVNYARHLAEPLAKTLKTSQIRKIFTEVRKIEALWFDQDRKVDAVRRLNMLKPKMAYQAKRQEKDKVSPLKPLTDVLTDAINLVTAVNDPEQMDVRFRRFVELFEAILAYHKAFGAKE